MACNVPPARTQRINVLWSPSKLMSPRRQPAALQRRRFSRSVTTSVMKCATTALLFLIPTLFLNR
jgi:hypothetical protein